MKFSIFQIISLVVFSLFVSSCGKSKEEAVKDSLVSAEIYLSTKKCQDAIDVLEGVGRQNKNVRYLKDLASSYACRAGYSTTTFFGTDVKLTASPAPLGGTTLYSTSLSTATLPLTDDLKFRDLQTAIDILLYAGGFATTTDPSVTERAKYFSATEAGDMNTQLAFMMLVQLGKLMKVYGDAGEESGIKSEGSGSNTCFTDYTDANPAIQLILASDTISGSCITTTSSHPDLAKTVLEAKRRKRLCEGVVLLNGVLNVIPGVITAIGVSNIPALGNLTTEIEDQKSQLESIDSSYAPTFTVLSQTNCENDSNISIESLTSYYAIFYETLLQ